MFQHKPSHSHYLKYHIKEAESRKCRQYFSGQSSSFLPYLWKMCYNSSGLSCFEDSVAKKKTSLERWLVSTCWDASVRECTFQHGSDWCDFQALDSSAIKQENKTNKQTTKPSPVLLVTADAPSGSWWHLCASKIAQSVHFVSIGRRWPMLADWDLKSCRHALSMGGKVVLALASRCHCCHRNITGPKVAQQNTYFTTRPSLWETTRQWNLLPDNQSPYRQKHCWKSKLDHTPSANAINAEVRIKTFRQTNLKEWKTATALLRGGEKIWFPAEQTAGVSFGEAHLILTDFWTHCHSFSVVLLIKNTNINYLCNKANIIEMKRGLIGEKMIILFSTPNFPSCEYQRALSISKMVFRACHTRMSIDW